ncbi:MAG: hypothetical protein C0606_06975 [Hyphomicrobiales bacterium]|nr:MAG: hypothetical protein C0606_06975 [Hyphomicrobiales bacterium]
MKAVFRFALAALVAGLSMAIAADSRAEMTLAEKPSDFRPGKTVVPIYRQYLGMAYTTWAVAVESADGTARKIYFETNEKAVNKGMLTLTCGDPFALTYEKYGWGKFGDAGSRQTVQLGETDILSWREERFEPLMGEDLPYEAYVVARFLACGAAG